MTKKKHAGGRPPMPEDERMSVQLGLRVDAETVARLDAVAAKLGLLSRAEVTRECMFVGLDVAERDAMALVRHAAKRTKKTTGEREK